MNQAIERWEEGQARLQEDFLKEQKNLQVQQQEFDERMAKEEQDFLQNLFAMANPQNLYYAE